MKTAAEINARIAMLRGWHAVPAHEWGPMQWELITPNGTPTRIIRSTRFGAIAEAPNYSSSWDACIEICVLEGWQWFKLTLEDPETWLIGVRGGDALWNEVVNHEPTARDMAECVLQALEAKETACRASQKGKSK